MPLKTQQTLAEIGDWGDRCLIIPEGLSEFSDAQAVMQNGQQAIFHKLIKSEAFGVEFYNNTPCMCFVMNGQETFVTPKGEEIVVGQGEMIMLPRNVFMVSNFWNATGPLESFLFFFGQSVISEFSRRNTASVTSQTQRVGTYKIDAHDSLTGYIQSMHSIYRGIQGTRELLHTKLMELLYLVAVVDEPRRLRSFLHENNSDSGRRNIRHLMHEHQTHNLNVSDFARLSGRSISAFNREFKRQYGIAPSRWLIEQRLTRAHDTILTSDASITEIGFEIGYDNTSYFIAQFKSRFGITPKRLRMENL